MTDRRQFVKFIKSILTLQYLGLLTTLWGMYPKKFEKEIENNEETGKSRLF